MQIEFKILGKPQGKARPRVCRVNGKSITYTPKKTVEYENLVKASYNAASKVKFQKNTPLEMTITAFFNIPKSVGKTSKKLMISGSILPTKKPDCDNVIKVICDALNGVAYCDDSQICKIKFIKKYAENPCIDVKIREIMGEK